MNNKFASRLTEIIEERGISKRSFAKMIDVSAQSVSDWTTGKVQPTAENIYAVALALDVSSDFLLGLEDEEG